MYLNHCRCYHIFQKCGSTSLSTDSESTTADPDPSHSALCLLLHVLDTSALSEVDLPIAYQKRKPSDFVSYFQFCFL